LLTLGSGGIDDSPDRTITLSARATLERGVPSFFTEHHLVLAFVDPIFQGAGFDALRLRITQDGNVIFDLSLGDASAAASFLDDRVLTFAIPPEAIEAGHTSIAVTLDLIGDEVSSAFLTNVAVGFSLVPEPGTGSLVVVGLLLMTRRRGSRRP